MKSLVKKIPVLGPLAQSMYQKWIKPPKAFSGSEDYWRERYDSGGTSGHGSYGKLAEFKAQIINEFVRENAIETVIEYGCGDGNQLKLADYPSYLGFDVSPKAIAICKDLFGADTTKTFNLIEKYDNETADLTLSLDVIYHLVEDDIFVEHMNRLFDSSRRFVIIYASDSDVNPPGQAAHVRHRNFTKWVRERKAQWRLLRHLQNKYPHSGKPETGSAAEFYFYQRQDS
jgi:hypothetical protein